MVIEGACREVGSLRDCLLVAPSIEVENVAFVVAAGVLNLRRREVARNENLVFPALLRHVSMSDQRRADGLVERAPLFVRRRYHEAMLPGFVRLQVLGGDALIPFGRLRDF